MSTGSLRHRLKRLEERTGDGGPVLAVYRSSDPAHRAEVDEWAERMEAEGRIVLRLDLGAPWAQPVGPPTRRRPRPGEDDFTGPVTGGLH